jgi:hypothetical protein
VAATDGLRDAVSYADRGIPDTVATPIVDWLMLGDRSPMGVFNKISDLVSVLRAIEYTVAFNAIRDQLSRELSLHMTAKAEEGSEN